MPISASLEAFLAEPRNVMVAGIRKDGRPHLSPNWSGKRVVWAEVFRTFT